MAKWQTAAEFFCFPWQGKQPRRGTSRAQRGDGGGSEPRSTGSKTGWRTPPSGSSQSLLTHFPLEVEGKRGLITSRFFAGHWKLATGHWLLAAAL